MGQRSQIYVRIENPKTKEKFLIARYFQWNYGERMVSRARGIVEWLESYLDEDWQIMSFYGSIKSNESQYRTKLERIIDTNFDMRDITFSCDIIEEYKEDYYDSFKDVFTGQDNNDGQLFVDVSFVEDGTCVIFGDEQVKYVPVIKYCFVTYCCGETPLTATQYLNWDFDTWKTKLDSEALEYTLDNIKFLNRVKRLTATELEEYRDYDYISDMGLERKVEAV